MLLELTMLLIAVLCAIVTYKLLKAFWPLILNSVCALAALWLINAVFGLGIAISIWSVLIVAIGGIPGLLLVFLLHILGIAF